jgi:aminoglycoside 6'-N-acetyltransferase
MTDDLHPTLVGDRVIVRPGRSEDAPAVHAILTEPSVARWWVNPDPPDEIEGHLLGSPPMLLVIEVAGDVVGGIQYHEELDPQYHHAGIDLFLGEQWQNRGLGTEAIRLVARFLFEQRRHHRLTIDPAATNKQAIASYQKVGFRPVGILRQYEKGADGTWRDGLLLDLLRDELRS